MPPWMLLEDGIVHVASSPRVQLEQMELGVTLGLMRACAPWSETGTKSSL